MDTYGTAYRDSEIRPYLTKLVGDYPSQESESLPEPIAEGVVSVETGETFDPTTYEPSSGAIGLGQITTTGQEWAWWKENHPDATADMLYDPEYNMDVMYYGLWRRHAEAKDEAFVDKPAAQQDWYMATAGYLGGADNNGFNGAADALGTDGPTYAKAVFDYIARTFGEETAESIDKSQPGTAFADGYGKPARFDATADPTKKGGWIDTTIAIGGDLIDGGKGVVTGTLEKAAQQVINYIESSVRTVISAAGPFMLRVGFFVVGLALLVIGVRQVFAA